MTPDRWRKIEELYHAALHQTAERRREYLRDICGEDESLRRSVEELLEHESTDLILDEQLWNSAAEARFVARSTRFALQQKIGAGSFGAVYRAFDRERNSLVALKTLLQLHPTHLLRFKREFRSLVDLAHPNLVQLYELFGEHEQWFFTMELVDGVDFLTYVRPANILAGWDRLRNAIFQLARGVQALHAASLVHRDLKPSNVLVASDGRVVILDLGLVRVLESSESFALAGSPAYMAPEHAFGAPVSPAIDWYAVGVILYNSITGELPFSGTVKETLERKRAASAPECRELNPDSPEELAQACRLLLDRDPAIRSRGAAILLAINPKLPAIDESKTEIFVGRRSQLDLLRDGFAAVRSGERRLAMLHGKSGFGKTTLLSRFLSEVKRAQPDAVIFRGRCRSSEAVPYKALDAIADDIVRYLKSMPEASAAALLPRNPGLLRRLFPVFSELKIASSLRDRADPDSKEQDARKRAFEALSELLGRMADRSPVVVAIDDLQWSDLDSIAFLGELVIPTSSPSLMLLLCYRSEESDTSPALVALHEIREQLSEGRIFFDVEAGGLLEGESRELLRLLLTDQPGWSEEQFAKVITDSGGSPLLLGEMIRFASDIDRSVIDISEIIRRRAAALAPSARELLEALSVADEPLSAATLYRVAQTPGADAAREAGLLIREHFVRDVAGAYGEMLEPFHDKIRETILACLSEDELRAWHSRLAKLLNSEENPDPKRILRHYLGCGDLQAAYRAALDAAASAEAAFAFDQAARFCDEAIRTGQASERDHAYLLRRQAEALAKAGRGYYSAQCYLDACRWPAHNDVTELQCRAAEQYMRAGYLDQGTEIYSMVFRRFGLRLPEKPLESVLRMLSLRLLIRIRGLGWRERSAAKINPATLQKLDVLWSGALVLLFGNPIFGNYLQARHMLGALRCGEPYRLALTFCGGALYESLGGTREETRGFALIRSAEEIAERLNNSYIFAIIHASRAGVNYMSGRLEQGLKSVRKSATFLDSSMRGWEWVSSSILLIWFLSWSGRILELAEELPQILEDGRSRGDVYANVSVRCLTMAHLVDLAKDDPENVIVETTRCIKQWRKSQYDLQHFGATIACMDSHLYAGRLNEARRLLLADWPAIRKSLLFRKTQLYRIILFYARGRTALATWLPDARDRDLYIEIGHYTKRLQKSGSPWGDSFAFLLQAGVHAGLGHTADAIRLLEQAENILRDQDLKLVAAVVLRRRGELLGPDGATQIEVADSFMRSEKIARPEHMTAMFLPGKWI